MLILAKYNMIIDENNRINAVPKSGWSSIAINGGNINPIAIIHFFKSPLLLCKYLDKHNNNAIFINSDG